MDCFTEILGIYSLQLVLPNVPKQRLIVKSSHRRLSQSLEGPSHSEPVVQRVSNNEHVRNICN